MAKPKLTVLVLVLVFSAMAGGVACATASRGARQETVAGDENTQSLTGTITATIYLPMVTQSPSGRSWPATTNGISVFNDQICVTCLNDAQAQFAATHYAGAQKLARSETRRLREYNPSFLVLHYRLGQALGYREPDRSCQPTGGYLQIINGDDWVQEWPGDAVVQENWFFHWNGSRVFQCQWGHYLAELDDPGWRTWWSEQVIQQLQNNENDGLFADSYSVANYLGLWNPSLPAVDTAFENAWAEREHNFTDYIRGQFAGRWKWIPNVGAWVTTRDPSDYSNVDGAMIEGFAEWGGGSYFDLVDWQLQMNRILSLVAADKILIAQNYPDPSDVDERLFILGSYLLIKGRYTYINLETSMEAEWFPEYGIDLGTPTDALPADISTYLDSTWGVYVRHYANGMVLVNPSDAARAVNLGGTYRRVLPSGGGDVPASGIAPGSLSTTAVTQVVLDPHRAVILLNP